jgi:hypothetical protein
VPSVALLLECCKHAVLKFKQKDHGDMFSLYRCGGIPREISPYGIPGVFFSEKKKNILYLNHLF